MIDYSIQNKKAWEYNAYDFWVKEAGLPADRAKKIVANPIGTLKRYANYFDTHKGIRVANICGSCGKKAVPLAVLGADVTVFDISEDNKRYAALKNIRSQHVLEKVGFRYIREDDTFKYYRCERIYHEN